VRLSSKKLLSLSFLGTSMSDRLQEHWTGRESTGADSSSDQDNPEVGQPDKNRHGEEGTFVVKKEIVYRMISPFSFFFLNEDLSF
jgi:hypothetical protein